MRARGFTILEAMIALAIILVGILAITRLQTTHVSAGTASKQRVEATMLTQQLIEGMRAFSAVATTAGATSYEDIASGSDTVTLAGTTYTREWTATAGSGPQHKVLVVSVSWPAAGKTESVSLSTIIAPADPALSGRLITGN